VQYAEVAGGLETPGSDAAARRRGTTSLVGQLLLRHPLDHLAERGVGHVAADALHGWGEVIHDLVQLPDLTGRSYELELHAHPLIVEWS
jgi:hypothetical protein